VFSPKAASALTLAFVGVFPIDMIAELFQNISQGIRFYFEARLAFGTLHHWWLNVDKL
jgi:hypothetical protein